MGKAADKARDVAVDDTMEDERDAEQADHDRVAAAANARFTQSEYQLSWLRNTWTITRREFKSYFDSPLAYVILCGSLALLGVLFFFMPPTPVTGGSFWQIDRATMAGLFAPFPLIFCVICPIVTMRSLAEEKRMGTLELLITMPVRDSEVIMGKYFGALGLISVLLIASFLFPVAIFAWPWHLGPLDWGVVWTAYLGLFLCSAASIAIGIFFSSMTESQMLALFGTMITLVVLYAVGFLADLIHGPIGDTFGFLSFYTRFMPFSRGLIDTRAIIYFLSITVIALLLAFRKLESRKWA